MIEYLSLCISNMRGYPGGTQYHADGRHDSVRTPFAAMSAH